MVGGPGSGKTSGLNVLINMLKRNKDDFVSIDPDDILKIYFNSNRKYYHKVEPINNALYEKALKGNYNLIFDRTGTNYEIYYNTVIKKIKEAGYNIVLCIVYNNYYNVHPRLKKREAETGRAVNDKYARNSYRDLTFNIPKYINLNCDDSDDIFVFDNTLSSIELIYRSQCENGKKKLLLIIYSNIFSLIKSSFNFIIAPNCLIRISKLTVSKQLLYFSHSILASLSCCCLVKFLL